MSDVTAILASAQTAGTNTPMSATDFNALKAALARDPTLGSAQLNEVREFASANRGVLSESRVEELARFVGDLRTAQSNAGGRFMDALNFVGLRCNPASWVINRHMPFTLPR